MGGGDLQPGKGGNRPGKARLRVPCGFRGGGHPPGQAFRRGGVNLVPAAAQGQPLGGGVYVRVHKSVLKGNRFSPGAQAIQKVSRRFFRQGVTLGHRGDRLRPPVAQKSPQNSLCWPVGIGGGMLLGNPQPGFDIHGPARRGQLLQPLGRRVDFPGGQVAFRHQKRMQLFRVFYFPGAVIFFRQRLRVRGDTLQPTAHFRVRGGGNGRFVHHFRFHLTAQGQRHGGGLAGVQLHHPDFSGGNGGKHPCCALHVQIILPAFPAGFPDERVVFLPHGGGEGFRAPQPLHPQGIAAVFSRAHHAGAGRGVSEGHGENALSRQKSFQ